MMEVSTSFDTLSQTSSPNRMKARSSNRQRREEQLEGLRSTLRSLRSYQEETAAAAGNTGTLESRSTLRGRDRPAAATATVGGRRSFSNAGRARAAPPSPSWAGDSSCAPPPVPVDVIAAVRDVMGAQSQSGITGLNGTVLSDSRSRLTSRRGSVCSCGAGGTLRRAPSEARLRRNTYGSNSGLSSTG